MPAVPPGLCDRCLHRHDIVTRTSTFVFCQRSRTDPAFARYPALPVLACRGFEPWSGRGNPDEEREETR
jgi:hypothetical protein